MAPGAAVRFRESLTKEKMKRDSFEANETNPSRADVRPASRKNKRAEGPRGCGLHALIRLVLNHSPAWRRFTNR
jgi:hypothetical protein